MSTTARAKTKFIKSRNKPTSSANLTQTERKYQDNNIILVSMPLTMPLTIILCSSGTLQNTLKPKILSLIFKSKI